MKLEQKNTPVVIAATTFIFWGTLSIYWSQLHRINAIEIVAYRALSSTLFAGILVVATGCGLQVLNAFKNRKLLLLLSVSSTLILSNWLLFIYAVTHGHIVETSMGYYINPLLNVLAAAIIFKVKMNKTQIVSLILVTVGVLNLVISYGSFPYVAIALAISFCLYGVVRKIAPIDALAGLFVEALIIAVPAILYLFFLTLKGSGAIFTASKYEMTLLIVAGVVTTLPLAGFAFAAKKLNLATLGLLQYISPTVSFFIGVFMYHEIFTKSHLLSFTFIWVALAIYSVDAVMKYRHHS